MTTYRKKLIEVALPLDAINDASAREKSIRHGHPSGLHLWWARRPLAACRAILFAQLVDDPSAWPDLFPSDEAQETERKRLFRLIEELVRWESSADERVLNAARLEVARSCARGRIADGQSDAHDAELLDAAAPKPGLVNDYLRSVAPIVHDPFAGGGSVPLEAQRLGLRAVASDLNPVAVLINKALIEIPAQFQGRPPVNPEGRGKKLKAWHAAEGLADDVRYYGRWLRDEAFKKIGHLYPKATLPSADGGGEATVLAWLWARTVASPNPSCGGKHVPLVASFWLGRKKGKEAWLEPVVDREKNEWRIELRKGPPQDAKAVAAGTKVGRGDFRCLLSGDPIPASYVRQEGQAGRLGSRLLAVIAEGQRRRLYIQPTPEDEQLAAVPTPDDCPATMLPEQALGFRVQNYGMRSHSDLFTPRQLTALTTFTSLVDEARGRVLLDMSTPDEAYADAVATYLAMGISRLTDYCCTISTWASNPQMEIIRNTFARQALPMTWDYAESNPFATSSGSLEILYGWIVKVLEHLAVGPVGTAIQASAQNVQLEAGAVVSTDPPYYDNVPYADLSDFFYVWLRRSLRSVYPKLLSTLLVPKAEELVAEPFRHGGREGANQFFEQGMTEAIMQIVEAGDSTFPTTIYYAFKQTETSGGDTSSTGWETFLAALRDAGFAVVGTWPIRTERKGRMREVGSNALATSVALVCRKRPADAATITRSDFRRLLRQELPSALKNLQHGNIAPVDMAQTSIGPGMAIFSRHKAVLEADGNIMSVRTALQLINQALDEFLAEQEGEFDSDTRFAVTWFDEHQFDAGPFGQAETLAMARNVSVAGVVEAGVVHSAAGKVRLLKRSELPEDWDPVEDKRLTVWEAAQHLIKRLEAGGEQEAAALLARLGSTAEPARDLAYRLYQTCERKGWAEEARSYNGLVIAWPELEKLAETTRRARASQGELFDAGNT